MKRLPSILSILAMAPILSGPTDVAAQAMKGHDSDAPVNFSADRIEVQDRADRVVLSGNVDVVQAEMTLNAARMTVAYRNADNLEIDRIDASGKVVVKKRDQTATGDVAIYDLNRRLITMLGNVRLTQGTNRLSGGRLVIDLTTGRSTVDGRSANAPAGSTTGASGRVSGTFSAPKRTNQSQ